MEDAPNCLHILRDVLSLESLVIRDVRAVMAIVLIVYTIVFAKLYVRNIYTYLSMSDPDAGTV